MVPPLAGLLPWQSLFLAFCAGIFSFKYPVPSLTALGLLLFVDFSLRGRASRVPFLLFLLCAGCGFGYTSLWTPAPVEIPIWMTSRTAVRVTGTVDRVEPRIDGRFRILLREITCQVGERKEGLPGKLAWTWRKPDVTPLEGQTVTAFMRVVPLHGFTNPGAWDFSWYWQRQGVFWRAWRVGQGRELVWGDGVRSSLGALKVRVRHLVAEHIPDTQGGAMVLALVTGDRSQIELETSAAMRAAGLAHTLALSGLHVGFVAAMGFALAWLIGRLSPDLLLLIPRPKLAVFCAAPLVAAYAWLGQPSPSLTRSAIMFGFWGVLLLQGRGRVLLDGLFFALVVIIFAYPLALYDLSLQMSALAVAGIGLMYPVIRRFFMAGSYWGLTPLLWAAGVLGVSFCATTALLPLVSRTFGSFCPNILFNVIWLPTLGFIVMPMGILGTLLCTFSWTVPVGGSLLAGSSIVMNWLLSVLAMAGEYGLTPVFSVLRPLWPEMLGVCLLLLLALVAWSKRRFFPVLTAVGFLFMVWPHVAIMAADTEDVVKVTLLDVGQGQAVVVSVPGGHRWLIDGGAGSRHFDFGEAVVAPTLTFGRPPRLDGVFMSHPDVDHSHGLPFILSRFDVGAFYGNGTLPRGRTGKRLRAAFEKKKLVPVTLHAGQRLALGRDISLDVLHPALDYKNRHANERSLVLRLMRREHSLALIPGDVEENGIKAMMDSGVDLRADILVLPHHGSKSSLVPAFYGKISPFCAVCSSGYLNQYGFPHKEVVKAVGVPVFATGRYGQVTAQWGRGRDFSLRVARP